MRGILTILKYRTANYHEGRRNSPEIQNYVESLLSCGWRGRQVTFSWGPKSEKWPINPVKNIPGKGNNTLEAWMWFSTKPMARTQSVEWRKVQGDIRKRTEADHERLLGKETWDLFSRQMGSHWRIINLEWHDYFFLNPEQLYEEKLREVER